MKYLIPLALLLASIPVLHADDIPPIISQSSDGNYQIKPELNVDVPSNLKLFRIALFDARQNKKIYSISAQYDIPHGSDWITMWHPSLPIVAVNVADARRFGHIELYSVIHGKVEKLIVPDYLQNALGRVNAVGTDNTAFSKLRSWHNNNLTLELLFNARNETNGEFQGFYSCNVVLRVLDDDPPFVQLLSVSKPQKQ